MFFLTLIYHSFLVYSSLFDKIYRFYMLFYLWRIGKYILICTVILESYAQ